MTRAVTALALALALLAGVARAQAPAPPLPPVAPEPRVAGPLPPDAPEARTAGPAAPLAVAPPPPASGPDVELNVPGATVKRVALDVESLEARLDLDTSVADLVHVRAGVVARVQNLRLELEEVQTSAQLLVRLERVTDVLGKALDAIDRRPELAGPAAPSGAAASLSPPPPQE